MIRKKSSSRYFLILVFFTAIVAALIITKQFIPSNKTNFISNVAPISGPILIRNVNVIDATGSDVQTGMNVLIRDGRIHTISALPIDVSPDVAVIDATNRYLMPGLWDMHVHANAAFMLPLFIANGVTGVREMWGRDMHHQWRKRIGEKGFVSPRFYIASIIVDGDPPYWPGSIGVADAEQGRAVVRRFHKLGSDFVKVYSQLDRPSYFAIADESKKLGIPFAGHIPNSVTAEEAAEAGQASVEHLTVVDRYLNYTKSLRVELYQTLRDHDVWQSPTLTVARNISQINERKELDKERLLYLPVWIVNSWDPKQDRRFKDMTDTQWVQLAKRFERHKKMVGEMNEAGVRFLAGTDVSNPYCIPGFSLHDELELLVESGLTPMQAIQAATRNAAEFMGKLDEFGTVAEGKVADLVLLRNNPLQDIRNTTSLEAVIFEGQIYNRTMLDDLLEQAKRNAGN